MSSPIESGNLRGTKIDVPGPATWISRPWRTSIAQILTALLNFKVLILSSAGGGATVSSDADVTISTSGVVVTIDLSKISGGGNFRQFSGVGSPSASTLPVGNYIGTSTLPADVYFDITTPLTPNYWICVQDGTESTSVWFNLTGCP